MPLRPTGHIAGNLNILAIGMHHRMKSGSAREVFVGWVADDGCVFMAPSAHPKARAITAHAPEQVVQRYRKQPGFGWADILDDLAEARDAFMRRSLQAAEGEPLHV